MQHVSFGLLLLFMVVPLMAVEGASRAPLVLRIKQEHSYYCWHTNCGAALLLRYE